MTMDLHMELLLLYVREDGLFARLITSDRETAVNVPVRKCISEESLKGDLNALLRLASKEVDLENRRVTVTFALSRRVEVLKPCVSELLFSLPFADSVSVLSRDELFYRAVTTLSSDDPCQILYCDTRETRLFTQSGEVPLFGKRTGGNGFYDWLLGFVENEEDSFEYYEKQLDRMKELFRVYRCFSPVQGETTSDKKEIFPNRTKHPLLYSRPAISDREAFSSGLLSDQRRKGAPIESEPAPVESESASEERIDYTELSASDRSKVDRKLPALYRLARDKYGQHGKISMGRAAERFAQLFDGIRDAKLSRLVVVGAYADFPLTGDFLRSLPQGMTVSYESESRLLLDGMEQAVVDRIYSSRLLLHDMDGEELVLWNSCVGKSDICPEKRICFSATLKRSISREEWKRKTPQMPYVVEFEELRRDENGVYKRVRITQRGDFRKFCYQRHKDGSYRLCLPEAETTDSSFRTVLLGVSATPLGVTCRLLPCEE